MSAGDTELEITLVIRSEEPLHVVEQLAALERFGTHALHLQPTLVLHDRYFDLNTGVLRQSGFALRLRQSAGHSWLCLKGRSRRHGLAVERVEIEGAIDDPQLLGRMAAALAADRPGVSGPKGSAARALAILGTTALARDPVGVLGSAGWRAIQDRETLRRPRTVLIAGNLAAPQAGGDTRKDAEPDVATQMALGAAIGPPVIAQLAIDTVTYAVAGMPMRHHEVEIEAGADITLTALAELAQALQAAFPVLQPWRPSKLYTGFALEALSAHLGPTALVTAAGDLLPRTYSLILEQKGAGRA